MDFMSAFFKGEQARAAGASRTMVFDWEKAASLIRQTGATDASAGLSGDWGYTGGKILEDGEPVPAGETYTYLASFWAKPELDIDGEIYDCWRYDDDGCGWDADTYWPGVALGILHASE